jgi:hypothetical protein
MPVTLQLFASAMAILSYSRLIKLLTHDMQNSMV